MWDVRLEPSWDRLSCLFPQRDYHQKYPRDSRGVRKNKEKPWKEGEQSKSANKRLDLMSWEVFPALMTPGMHGWRGWKDSPALKLQVYPMDGFQSMPQAVFKYSCVFWSGNQPSVGEQDVLGYKTIWNWLSGPEQGTDSTKIMDLIPVGAIHCRAGLDDPCEPLPNQLFWDFG